jgi:hypothetical protein
MTRVADQTRDSDADRAAISGVVQAFFAAFTTGPDLAQRLADLRTLFLPEALIITTSGGTPTVYDVDGFITPREALLSRGDLVDFREWPTDGHIDVFGDIAQHFGGYAKTWVQEGVEHTGRGRKSMQLVRVDGVWRISAVAWDDERDGVLFDA